MNLINEIRQSYIDIDIFKTYGEKITSFDVLSQIITAMSLSHTSSLFENSHEDDNDSQIKH